MAPMRTYRELFGIREFRVLFASTSLNVAAGSVGSLALGTLTYARDRVAASSPPS